MREALRSGDIYLPQSRRHSSFSDMMYDPKQWLDDRKHVYDDLKLPTGPQQILEQLTTEFDEVTQRTERGLPQNSFARILNGELRLRRPDNLDVPDEVKPLRRLLTSHLPIIRIEKLVEAGGHSVRLYPSIPAAQRLRAEKPASLWSAPGCVGGTRDQSGRHRHGA
jgi:hypothetical protein